MRTDPAPPGRRQAVPALAALNRYSLRTLLAASVGLVVLFCALVVLYLQVSQGVTLRMMDSLINVDNELSDLCLKSHAGMIQARRLEKDFLLNTGEFGFDESRSRYITRLLVAVAEIRGNLKRIRDLAGDAGMVRLAREAESALEEYRGGIEALVEKTGEMGDRDTGVHGAMRVEGREIERLVRGQRDEALLATYLEMRRAERGYVERAMDADVVEHAEASRRFAAAVAAAVAAARLPAGAGAELGRRIGGYRALFGQLVQATEALRAIRKQYLGPVQEVESALERLYADSRGRVAAKRAAIERSTRHLSLPVVVAGVLVLGLTAVLALAIVLAVTRSVVETKSFAEQIASGDLGGRLAPAGRNEFTALATSLNTMAASLQEAAAARERDVAALRESEERYRALVETSTDWIWAIDRAGMHTYSNERVREILGIAPEEVLRADTLALVHPEDAPRVRDLIEASVAAGAGWRGVVVRWRHRDGSWRWLESSAVPTTDAQGILAGFRGTDRDVTERRLLEAELAKTQKLEAIGTLAGGIAHDFNNLLQGLFGYLSLAKMNLGRPDRAAGLLEQAEKALGLSVNLTTQLLTFAKGGKPVKSLVALPEVVEDAAKFALSGSRSDYRISCSPDLPAVYADGGQLGQVFQNLVLNASEAMPQGGTVAISARGEALEPGSNPLVPAGGDFVRIDVKDTGAGISGADLARIFDPYFTTKEKGSGLGLATSYSIVRAHHGFIDVTSRVGEGSVFTVYLPASGSAEAGEPEEAPGGGGVRGRVLVMDDDALVRDAAAGMMEALGHEVATAADGEEALARYRDARGEGRPFDVVVLDLTVRRGMGGEEAMRRLLELDPGVKAVVSSGYSDASVMADFRSHGFAACLSKPYKLQALRSCLDALLHPPGAAAPGEPG